MVKTAVVFGCETWVVVEMRMKRLGIGDREILRRMHGQVVEQGKWRTRTNQKLGELYKDLDSVGDIKKQILEWIGYVVRIDQGRREKKIFESNPEGNRRRERPRFRWLEDV
jgi:hypothetical protein